MKKITVFFLFMMLIVSAGAAAADKPLGVEEFTSIEELALSLSSYFPKAQGMVKSVQGERVIISLGKKEGLIPGMELTLWREGREILHPMTKAVIGRAEDQAGTIEVTSVGDTTSTAIMKKKMLDPREGDKARITPRKINMAVVPLRQDHPDIVRTLVERLNEFGRMNVLDTAKVDAFVKNSKAKDMSLVRELGTAFGLDAVVSLGIYPSEGKLMATARIFYTDDASQLDTIVAMLDLKSRRDGVAEIKPFFTPEKKEAKAATAELPFMVRYFGIGDFEGNGIAEYVFSDGNRLHIYRNEPSGWREIWTETDMKREPGRTMEWQGQSTVTVPGMTVDHIHLDVADINGNGRPEIFVTAMVNGAVKSYIFEYQDGSFRRIAELPGFVRVVFFPNGPAVLIGQAYDPVSFYSGRPKQYSWSEGKYVPGDDFPLPKGLGVYGWTYAHAGDRQPLLFVLDEEDRVQVYAGESAVWKSTDQYPIVDQFVYRPATGIEAALTKQAGPDKGRRMRLPGRIEAIDLNGDGKDEIVIVKNLTTNFMGGFSGAEFDAFAWTGSRLDPAWSIRDIPGPVYDFCLTRDQAGTRVTSLVKTKGNLFAKDRQQIMMYTVK